MIERMMDYPGYLLRFRAEDRLSSVATVFFHGFPAIRHLKNLDIADAVYKNLNLDSYILHYRGLGESLGVFGFEASIQESKSALDFILQKGNYRALYLVGHSWGGLVATYCASIFGEKVEKLVLLSPVTKFSKGDPLYHYVREDVLKEVPHLFAQRSESEIEKDVDNVIQKYLTWNQVAHLSAKTKVTILQAKDDEVTLTSLCKEMLSHFKLAPVYKEIPLDHGFYGDRKLISSEVIEAIR